MSEHTKGELKVSNVRREIVIIDQKGNVIANFTVNQPPEYIKKAIAYAERFALCWKEHDELKVKANCHDELVAACEATIGFCVNLRQLDCWEKHQDAGVLFAIAKAALAKVGEK